MHGAAVAKVERSYQHVDLARSATSVGSWYRAGRQGQHARSVRAARLELDGVVDPRELSSLVKQLEADGLAFEGAEASFELLIRRHTAD